MAKRALVSSDADVKSLESKVLVSATVTVANLRKLLKEKDAISVLYDLKFRRVGRDPLDSRRPLNLIKQLNQTFTYLVTLGGARIVLKKHGRPLELSLGTSPGYDIASADGTIAAEAFAATRPDSNDKLRKDRSKVEKAAAQHQYVFYHCPSRKNVASRDGAVRVLRVNLPGQKARRRQAAALHRTGLEACPTGKAENRL